MSDRIPAESRNVNYPCNMEPLMPQQLIKLPAGSIKPGGSKMLLHVNSLGYHEVYVNGMPVTDAVLSPAVSEFDKRSLIVTYDVTPLLKKGENDLLLWLGKGWYQTIADGVVPGGPFVRAQPDAVAFVGI